MKLTALGDHVIIEPFDFQHNAPKHGIILPETAKEKPYVGKVVSVGESDQIKKGDKVLFRPYSGHDYGGFIALRLDEIVAVIDD